MQEEDVHAHIYEWWSHFILHMANKNKKMTVSNNERESLHVKNGKCFVITRILQQGNPNKFVST